MLDDAGTIRCLVAPFASITACYLPAIDAAKVVPIVICFPCLGYLWVKPVIVRATPPIILTSQAIACPPGS